MERYTAADVPQVVTCKALSLAYWRITGEPSWCTQAYNNEYGTRTQRSQMSQKQRRPVTMYTKDGQPLRTFPTLVEAARYIVSELTDQHVSVNTADNNIRAVCHHRPHRHLAYGYRWEFEE